MHDESEIDAYIRAMYEASPMKGQFLAVETDQSDGLFFLGGVKILDGLYVGHMPLDLRRDTQMRAELKEPLRVIQDDLDAIPVHSSIRAKGVECIRAIPIAPSSEGAANTRLDDGRDEP